VKSFGLFLQQRKNNAESLQSSLPVQLGFFLYVQDCFISSCKKNAQNQNGWFLGERSKSVHLYVASMIDFLPCLHFLADKFVFIKELKRGSQAQIKRNHRSAKMRKTSTKIK
jgi:hypothetical protein